MVTVRIHNSGLTQCQVETIIEQCLTSTTLKCFEVRGSNYPDGTWDRLYLPAQLMEKVEVNFMWNAKTCALYSRTDTNPYNVPSYFM